MVTPDELHDVYAASGAALWHLQFLEDVLVTYVTMRLHLKPGTPAAQAYAILARERRRTLGSLLKAAKEGGILAGATSESVRLLEDRNWLAHRLVVEYADALYKPEVRTSLLARLRTLADRAIELKKILVDETTTWCSTQGVDLTPRDGL